MNNTSTIESIISTLVGPNSDNNDKLKDLANIISYYPGLAHLIDWTKDAIDNDRPIPESLSSEIKDIFLFFREHFENNDFNKIKELNIIEDMINQLENVVKITNKLEIYENTHIGIDLTFEYDNKIYSIDARKLNPNLSKDDPFLKTIEKDLLIRKDIIGHTQNYDHCIIIDMNQNNNNILNLCLE